MVRSQVGVSTSETFGTTPEHESRDGAAPHLFGLLWVHPQERFVPFTKEPLTLGRSDEASVCLPSEHVSRTHAVIRRIGPLYVLANAGSRNGTFRNGQLVNEAPLDTNDVVRIGDWIGVVLALSPTLIASERYFIEPEPGVLLGPRSQEEWHKLEQVAPSRVPILIEGPTGSGKEVFARAVHRKSRRAGAFVGVNCAALPNSLVEAHLFGHARGAYTGALQASEGLVGAAHEGTLLLDEITDLPANQQAKLLRVIEENAVLRLGEVTPRPIDVRYVAACQRSLWDMVQRGQFRADLLGRLSGFRLKLSPLCERREEIARLFKHAFNAAGGDVQRLKASAIEALCLAPWPLNVRELTLAARSAAVSLREAGTIGRNAINDLLPHSNSEHAGEINVDAASALEMPAEGEAKLGRRRSLWLARHGRELEALRAALEHTRGNVSEAARQVGLSRSAATRMLEADTQRRRGSAAR